MSAPLFTPGPWALAERYGPDGWRVVARGYDIASALYLGGTDQAKANARLIAAAPELYEALALFVAEYVELVESGDAGFWDAEKESKVIIARAALAKARASAEQ